MSPAAAKIMEQAMQLSVEDRRELGLALLDTVVDEVIAAPRVPTVEEIIGTCTRCGQFGHWWCTGNRNLKK